jgi:uncharacterized protein YgiB involved in biofilm formation
VTWNSASKSAITADMFWRPLTTALFLLLFAAGPGLALTSCGDGDIRKGCKNYCKCHRGNRSVSACRERCDKRLTALKKRDRPRERQIADCLAARGERKCAVLAACAGDVLK